MNDAPVILIHVSHLTRIKFNLSGIYPVMPLGIAALGAVLEQAGVPVQLIDLNLPENRGFNPVVDLPPHVRFLGLSATIFSAPEAAELAARVRAARPDIPLALGGPINVFDHDTLDRRLSRVDAFVFGEGEGVIERLARCDFSPSALRELPGVGYREHGRFVVNRPAPPVDPDSLPYAARHLLPRRRYTMHPPFGLYPPVAIVETARGCPYACTFCSLPKVHRQRSIDHLLGEIRELVRIDDIHEIHFVDPTFTVDRARTLALCAALAAEPYRLAWSCKTRADLVDDELLSAMRRAGCYMISYGLESFNDEALDALSKGYAAQTAIDSLRATTGAGIRTLAYMLVANPGDTTASICRSVRILRNEGADYALFSGLLPDPQAPQILAACDTGRLTHLEIEEVYFDRRPLADRDNLAGFTRKQVRRWVGMSFVLFYFHPLYLLRRLTSIRSLHEIRLLLSGFWNLLKDLGRGLTRTEKTKSKDNIADLVHYT